MNQLNFKNWVVLLVFMLFLTDINSWVPDWIIFFREIFIRYALCQSKKSWYLELNNG